MYTSFRHIQIVIALLKQYKVRHLVLSPGARSIPFVRSVEIDDDFICHSVVDERSAAFFALGIASQLKEIVAIACTSSTATCNYYSAVVEAYHQQIPLLLLTFDRDQYMLGQMENQMIDQSGMYGKYCRKSVTITDVENERDFWYCQRKVNEAMLELIHRGSGPVQINIAVYKMDLFNIQKLPKTRMIRRLIAGDQKEEWKKTLSNLTQKHRILFVIGQTYGIDQNVKEELECFSSNTNCVVVMEHMANVHCLKSVVVYGLTEVIGEEKFSELLPDLIISYGGNISGRLKDLLKAHCGKLEHWSIREDGKLVDQFKNLSIIFESSLGYFLHEANLVMEGQDNKDNEYFSKWSEYHKKVQIKELEFSNFYVAQQLAMKIEKNAILHTGILNSTRQINFFELDPSINVYSNIGAFGIDGTMSTFIGQSVVTEKKCYLLIGDLSFLYDMNSASVRDIKSNVRMIVVNNGGGGEFHLTYGKEKIPTIDKHIAAGHDHSIKEWVCSLNYKYYSASTKKEFDKNLDDFIAYKGDRPAVLEVFTNMETDALITRQTINELRIENFKESSERKIVDAGKKILHSWQRSKMKKRDRRQ